MTDFLKLVNIENNKARGSCSIATINGAQSIAALKLSRSNKKLYSSGAYYIGNLLGTQRDGYGKLHWSLGCEYEGHYCKNKRDGRGTITWKDGSFYKGDFKNDLRHGYGEINFPNGEVYNGAFKDDMRHGHGVYVWPEQGKYEGYFEHDKKHGYGIFTMNNGDKFEGIYRKDQRWGPGIYTHSKSGDQDIGIWKGIHLLRICSVIENAFLLEHFDYHKINSGEKVSDRIRTSTAKALASRKLPEIFMQSNDMQTSENMDLSKIPSGFPYQDIVEGQRENHSDKGRIELDSEQLIIAAKNGDYNTVKRILEDDSVSPNVSAKTGFSPIMAAAINCHTEVMNLLLDHGANINQVTDEGLSVLLACHILLYTKENFVDNIAESITKENLYNAVEIDRKTGAVINRIERKMIMAIYEDNHRPFNSFRKGKITTMAKQSTIINKRMFIDGTGGGGGNNAFEMTPDSRQSNPDEEDTPCFKVDLWKVAYFQSSMERVKEVNEINRSFKETMLTNPHQFLAHSPFVGASSLNVTQLENIKRQQLDQLDHESDDEESSIASTIDKQQDADHTETSPPPPPSTPPPPILRQQPAFSTTVASIFGYEPATDFQALTLNDKQRRSSQNGEMMNKFINKERKPHLQNTIQLLLKRGANPNASNIPMSALFFAVKSAEPAAVSALLKQSADTSSRLKPLNLCPLHIAVALPCVEGVEITKLLLQYGADPNLRDSFCSEGGLEDGEGETPDGRTPLHIVCSREDYVKQCQKITRLLLEYGADPNLLCMGNAPLSLAIGSGNDVVVDTLLRYKADPSLKLTHGLGSILCVATSFQAERRRTAQERMKLIEKLIKHGGDMLTPVKISDKFPPGTIVDYGYHVFSQDRRIACTPYHALSSIEREVYNSRRAMLECIGAHLRRAARQKEELVMAMMNDSNLDDETHNSGRDEFCGLRFITVKAGPRSAATFSSGTSQNEIPHFNNNNKSPPPRQSSFQQTTPKVKKRLRYCYECARSIGVRLSPCSRCKEVFYCSKGCKVKAWNSRHRDECAKFAGIKCISSQSRADSPTPTNEAFNNQQQMKPKESTIHTPTINLDSPMRKPSKGSKNESFLPSIN